MILSLWLMVYLRGDRPKADDDSNEGEVWESPLWI